MGPSAQLRQVPRIIRTLALGVAVGLQQSLAHPRGDGAARPQVVQALGQVLAPVAAFVVDAVVDLLVPLYTTPIRWAS